MNIETIEQKARELTERLVKQDIPTDLAARGPVIRVHIPAKPPLPGDPTKCFGEP